MKQAFTATTWAGAPTASAFGQHKIFQQRLILDFTKSTRQAQILSVSCLLTQFNNVWTIACTMIIRQARPTNSEVTGGIPVSGTLPLNPFDAGYQSKIEKRMS